MEITQRLCTFYQMCLTDVPDDEGDLSRDLYALQTVQDSEDEDSYAYSFTGGDPDAGLMRTCFCTKAQGRRTCFNGEKEVDSPINTQGT